MNTSVMACSSIHWIRKLKIPTTKAGNSSKSNDSGIDKLFNVK